MQPSMTLIIKPFAAILLQLTLYVIVGNIAFMQQIYSLVIEHSTIYPYKDVKLVAAVWPPLGYAT